MMQVWNEQKFPTKLQYLGTFNSCQTCIYTKLLLIVVSKDPKYVYRVVFMDSNNAPIIEASESALEAYYLVRQYCLLLLLFIYVYL